MTVEQIEAVVKSRLAKEIKDGVQTFQHQIITMTSTNGQSPFVSVFMYLNEVKDSQTKADLALLIEEVLKQRIQGIPNEQGMFVSSTFPKLIYVLEEDNIHENSKYYYVTKLAAQCTSKRMVPDYISEKIMKQLKVDKNGNGHCFPSMGCVDGQEVITYKMFGQLYTESFERFWNRTGQYFIQKKQQNNKDYYRDLENVVIWDSKLQEFTPCYRVIKNHNNKWLRLTFSNGRGITCTSDHPFETENRGVVQAKDLKETDIILNDTQSYSENNIPLNNDIAWLLGFMLCDGCYDSHVFSSIALNGEDDIQNRFCDIFENHFNNTVNIKEQLRGEKGNYKDLQVKGINTPLTKIIDWFYREFEGKQKINRHIPQQIFSATKEAKLSSLAGMIDADGHINNKEKLSRIQIGSTNKELALQQLLLIQSLGMQGYLYYNHYDGHDKNKIRYRIEFIPSNELINYLTCKKKIEHFENNIYSNSTKNKQIISLTKTELFEKDGFSYDVTTQSEHFTVSGIYSHNCRSFLPPYITSNNEVKFYGRFNIGVCTLNLVHIALESERNITKFYELLEYYANLCYKAQMIRGRRLENTPSDVAPILWQHGVLARLKKKEKIGKLFYNGYASISLGYAGMYETIKYLTGQSHTSEGGKELAISILKKLNQYCEKWNNETGYGFSVYGTPIESTTYKFARANQRDFGIIPEVTEYDYITNSYHINVREEIDAFEKLTLESQFQENSLGGAISYVEVPDMNENIPAVLEIMKHIYDTIMYAELNTRSDYCGCCGYTGEIKLSKTDNGYIWKCPNCGNEDINNMTIVRRVCGYLGQVSNGVNDGRLGDYHGRVLHL